MCSSICGNFGLFWPLFLMIFINFYQKRYRFLLRIQAQGFILHHFLYFIKTAVFALKTRFLRRLYLAPIWMFGLGRPKNTLKTQKNLGMAQKKTEKKYFFFRPPGGTKMQIFKKTHFCEKTLLLGTSKKWFLEFLLPGFHWRPNFA